MTNYADNEKDLPTFEGMTILSVIDGQVIYVDANAQIFRLYNFFPFFYFRKLNIFPRKRKSGDRLFLLEAS